MVLIEPPKIRKRQSPVKYKKGRAHRNSGTHYFNPTVILTGLTCVLIAFLFFNIYLFMWLHWVLVAAYGIFDLGEACRIFSCGMWDLVP